MTDLERAATGEELPVDSASIEQTLSELWRVEKTSGDGAVTRAALWNVVACAGTQAEHEMATAALAKAASSVPQRTIIVRGDRSARPELASWISANCHMLGEGKQVCSEEIAVVAGGDRVDRVPPLVNALLIPDMPVAVWWVGDLPDGDAGYVDAMLEPADRLIVDSVRFDTIADLQLIARTASRSGTAPADLNWIRGEEWRLAAASLFDPPEMREKVRTIASVRIVAEASGNATFGERLESVYFAAWLLTQAGLDIESVRTEFEFHSGERRGITLVELEMEDSAATIERDPDKCVITTTVDGRIDTPPGVRRSGSRPLHELIVGELTSPESDALLLRVLPVATKLAARVLR